MFVYLIGPTARAVVYDPVDPVAEFVFQFGALCSGPW